MRFVFLLFDVWLFHRHPRDTSNMIVDMSRNIIDIYIYIFYLFLIDAASEIRESRLGNGTRSFLHSTAQGLFRCT